MFTRTTPPRGDFHPIHNLFLALTVGSFNVVLYSHKMVLCLRQYLRHGRNEDNVFQQPHLAFGGLYYRSADD